MKFFTPDPTLIKRVVDGSADIYFLETITHCDQFNYVVDPNPTTSGTVDSAGNFEVNITIIRDNQLPSNSCILPLVHKLDLGALTDTEVLITINLTIEDNQSATTEKNPEGSVIISTVHAEDESRPIKEGVY